MRRTLIGTSQPELFFMADTDTAERAAAEM
jgi:hypothetical protein